MPTTWTRVWSRACELFMPQGLKQKTVTNLILIRLHCYLGFAAGAEQNLKVITSAPQSQDIRIPIRIPLNGWFQFVILQNGWVAIPFNIFQASPPHVIAIVLGKGDRSVLQIVLDLFRLSTEKTQLFTRSSGKTVLDCEEFCKMVNFAEAAATGFARHSQPLLRSAVADPRSQGPYFRCRVRV